MDGNKLFYRLSVASAAFCTIMAIVCLCAALFAGALHQLFLASLFAIVALCSAYDAKHFN